MALTPTELSENSETPLYAITGQIPTLTGSDDPRVLAFNTLADQLIQKTVDEFKANVASMPPSPMPGFGSSFDVRYTLVSPFGNILSLKFEAMVYMDGPVHPYRNNYTLTYDLEEGREIHLDQLFLPGSAYLQAIANFCTGELQTRDIGFEELSTQGAAPTPENYRKWNITPDGLLITFDEYQVGAYAAGPQTVIIPYAELAALIDPRGPLAGSVP